MVPRVGFEPTKAELLRLVAVPVCISQQGEMVRSPGLEPGSAKV